MNLLWSGAAIYGVAVGSLYLLQGSLLFPRAAASVSAYPLPAQTEDLELVTGRGAVIAGYLVRSARPSRGLLIGFPGNAWNASDFAAFLARRLPDLDIVAFHYRGYQPSEGRPSERAFFADALLIHDAMVQLLRPGRVLAAGFSLGSGVAAWLARERPIDGLVLVTPFDSVQAIARARYPWVPMRALLKHKFRTDRHLADCQVPTSVIVAGADRIVPKARSERLIRLLRRPVLVTTLEGATHTGIYDEDRFDDMLRLAIERVIEPGPALRAA